MSRYTLHLVLVACLLITVVSLQFYLVYDVERLKGSFEPPIYEAFMSQAREVSLEEFIHLARSHHYELMLPTRLPKGLTLSTIYYKCCPLVAIVVYSARGVKDFRYSELAIEIAPNPYPLSEEYLLQLNRTSVDEYVIRVGKWYARISPKVEFGDEERRRIFGPHPMAIYWEGGLEYLISVLPPLTLEDLEYIVRGLAKAS